MRKSTNITRQLLRLKCQAYSTLSDSDEDSQAETRLTERMGKSLSGASPPKPVLVAPAALYLTAILEYVYLICDPCFASLTPRPDLFASMCASEINFLGETH